jgi:hypothetical protein
MAYAHQAEKMFEENVRLFAPPQTEPEKYNLYAGLANLARQLHLIQADLSQLRTNVEQLKRR